MSSQARASYQSYYDIKAGRSVPISSKIGQAQSLITGSPIKGAKFEVWYGSNNCQRQPENVDFRRNRMSFFAGQHAVGMQP